MTTGSCLCKSVRFEVNGPFDRMTHCHCSMCRKAHGAPFATYTGARREDFRWIQGEDAVARYESSPGFFRAFCPRCGSVVPDPLDEDRVSIPAGCLDGDPGVRPTAHIFATSKLDWQPLDDALPRFEGYSEQGSGPVVDRPRPLGAEPGIVRGSCLCDSVAFEVHTPITAAYNCHCSRCRKSRAAAHASNGLTRADGVVFVRGAGRLVSYKVPEAARFTQVFCATCGSPAPRIDSDRGIAVIPLAMLDDPPGHPPQSHIYVGSMAPWYTIPDDLPRHDEGPST